MVPGSSPGRPATRFSGPAATPHAGGLVAPIVAVDLGATRTRVAVFAENMTVRARVSFPTPDVEDGVELAERIARQAARLLGGSRPAAVGVGSVGPLDIRRGAVVNPPNVRARYIPLRDVLSEALGAPVYVVNDCVAAVYGEYVAGAGRGRRNVVYLTISSGIGAGAVVDGNLLLGKDGNAHEVGHVVVAYHLPVRCGCGGIGHWEALASGRNMWKLVRVLALSWPGPETELYRAALRGPVGPETVFKLWRGGDEFAAYVVEELARVNAAGLASVVNVYDPEVIIVGGSVALSSPELIERSARLASMYVTNRMPEVVMTRFGDDAVLVGAAWLARRPPENLLRVQGA